MSERDAISCYARRVMDREGPLTWAQELLFSLDRRLGPTQALNITHAAQLEGALDETSFARAFHHVVARHAPLRSRYVMAQGEPRVLPRPHEAQGFQAHDLSALAPAARLARLQQVLSEACAPFALDSGRVVRSALARLDDRRWAWIVAQHHIASDGWSMHLFCRELSAVYRALTSGHAPALRPLVLECADVAERQHAWLAGPQAEAQLDWWRRRLFERPFVPLIMPLDGPRGLAAADSMSRQPLRLSPDLHRRVRAVGVRRRVSAFMLGLSAFAVLLSRWLRRDDLLVGTLIANRTRPGSERVMGAHYNTVLLRLNVRPEDPVDELVRHVEAACLEVQERQELPFAIVSAMAERDHGLGSPDLLKAMFLLDRYPLEPLALGGVRVVELDPARAVAVTRPALDLDAPLLPPLPPEIHRNQGAGASDVTLILREQDGGLDLLLYYRTAHFTDAQMAWLLRSYVRVLDGLLTALGEPRGGPGAAEGSTNGG